MGEMSMWRAEGQDARRPARPTPAQAAGRGSSGDPGGTRAEGHGRPGASQQHEHVASRRAGRPPAGATDSDARRREGAPPGIPAARERRATDGPERANNMNLRHAVLLHGQPGGPVGWRRVVRALKRLGGSVNPIVEDRPGYG